MDTVATTDFSYIDFLKLALPVAVAFLVSTQVALIISSLQADIISPGISVIFNRDNNFANLTYAYSDTIVFRYGHLLNSALTSFTTLLITYIVVRTLMRVGVDTRKRI